MLKLKLQYFGHLMQRTDSLEKILMLGKIENCISMKNRNESLQVKDILFLMESVGCDSGEKPHAQLDLHGGAG